MVSIKRYPVPAALKPFLDRFGKALAWFACSWVAMAFFGYGLALISYSSRLQPGPATSADALRPDEGVIAWSDAGVFTGMRGAHFKMANRETTFEIPSDFIRDRENAKDIEDRLVPGNDIWFKATKDENKVLGLVVNPRTPKEKTLVFFDHTEKALSQQTSGLRYSGVRSVFVGLAILPLFGIFLGFRKRFQRSR